MHCKTLINYSKMNTMKRMILTEDKINFFLCMWQARKCEK